MKLFILVLLASLQLSAQWRFAHLSDTHIGSASGAEDLRRTVRDLNAQPDLKFVFITGDITEFGSDDQFRLAKQILDSLRLPWFIVPGNHDMKWSESGGMSFSAIFGSERFVTDVEGYRFIGMHQGPRMRMGDAYWTVDDVTWLDSVLHAMKPPVRRAFIATHYPSDSGIANWYALTAVAKRYNVQAFLNGHWHRNFFGMFDGIPGIVGRSNLRGRDSVGGYNIGEIRGDSLIYSTRIPGVGTKQPWHVLVMKEKISAESTSPNNVGRRSSIGTSSGVTTAWKQTSREPMNAPPAATKKHRAYPFHNGDIDIYSSANKKLFTLRTGRAVMATPAMDESRIVVSSTDSTITCYSLTTRKLLWRVKTGAAVVAPPVIDNGVVYCGASDRKFRAIDLTSGNVLWSYDSLGGHVEAKPLVTNDRVIFGAWDEHLYCLDKRTGSLVWKWKSDRPGTLLSPAVCEPVTANGKVYIVAPDRFLTVIDLRTGEQLWRSNRFQVRETIGISEDGNRVYIRTMNDSLYALSTTGAAPEVVWGVHAGFGYEINSSQLREKEGVLFCTTKNGVLLALDGKTGKVLWTFNEDVVIAHTPVPISGKRVLFSNVLGTVCEVHAP